MKTVKRHNNGKITIEGTTYGRITDAEEKYKTFITVEGVNYYPVAKKDKKAVV